MFANTVPGGVAGGVIGLHNLHGAGTPLASHGPHSTTPTTQHLQQLQQQSSSPPSTQLNPTIASNTSTTPGVGDIAGGQQHTRRPTGLPLYNINGNNGLPHYPGYGLASTAPLAPGASPAPIQSSNNLHHRNASFSFSSPHSSSQHPPVPTTPASAPPSATLPPSYRSSSVNVPGTGMQALPTTSLPHSSQTRSGPPPSIANHNVHTPNSTGLDPSKGQPTPPAARPAATSGSTVVPNASNGAASPATQSNSYGIGLAPHPAQLPSGGPSGTGCVPSSSDASRFFNTYLYDYLLKQGLLEVAHVFVTSGAEMELVDGPERAAMPDGLASNTVLAHKRRRSDGSPNDIASSSSPSQPALNGCASEAAGSNNSNKSGTAASEPIANERTLSSSGSTVSNTSHYGFNHVAGNRSGAAHDPSNGQSATSDPTANGSGIVGGSAGASNTSVESPRSSPRARHLLLDSLPKPKLAMDTDQGFLFEWWTIFWDVFRAKTGRASANAQPAQLYAQNVAAASMGLSLEHGGISKARREAMSVRAVANPADVQKGHVNERMLQQYNMMTPQMHLVHHPEPPITPAGRIQQPQSHLLPQHKQQLFLEHNARQQQQHHALLHQQQQQHQHQTQMQQQQAALLARQRHQHEMQQEAHLIHHQQLQQQHAQHMHHQMYPEQFPGAQIGALQQRQMMHNGRRVTGMVPPGQEHIVAMMPPPAVQQGSPLNPHQQSPYRPSRPPSRSGAPRVSSPFTANSSQPPREPSRASNHAPSPAYQNHPRTPSSHSSAVLPQTAVLPPNRRGSPGGDDPERKKRRLNESPGNPSAETQAQQLQMQAHHQLQMQQMSMHAHHQQRSMMTNNGLHHVSGPQGSMQNPNLPQNIEAYKQSMQAQHAQAMAATNAVNSMNASSPNTTAGMSPAKASVNKSSENNMPPPPGRNAAQAPTPQSTQSGTRPPEAHSTPLPRIVTPSSDHSQPNQPSRPASQNAIGAGGEAGSSEILDDFAAQQQRSMTLSHSQESIKSAGSNGLTGLNAGGDQSRNHHEDDIKVQSGESNQDLWLMGNGSGGGQHMNGMLGDGSDSPVADAMAPISGDIAVPSNDSLEQLFNGGDPTALEYDSKLFEAFINYDPTSTGADFG